MPRTRHAPEAGETLIEIVMSIMMVGIMVSAVVLAVGEGSQLTGVHQQLVTTDVALKNATEAVKSATFETGKSGAALSSDYWAVAKAAVPPGYTVSLPPPVRCVPKTTSYTVGADTAAACTVSTSAEGLQIVTLTVNSTASGTATSESTLVVKRKP